jgi:hypothetical protein
LAKFYSKIDEVVNFEEDFAARYELVKPKADYFKLKRFLTTALRNFREIDDKFIAGLLQKLQKDVYSLFDYYVKFQSSIQIPEVIYQQQFLTTLKPYVKVLDEISSTKATRDLYEMKLRQLDGQIKLLTTQAINDEEKAKELKLVKEKYADAVHNFALARDRVIELAKTLDEYEKTFHTLFLDRFSLDKKLYLERLTDAINIKAFYLDKLIWYRAERNRRIVDFMASAGIEGNYDTKTFIKYYLRNINISSSMDKEWHMYLKKAMEILE